MPQYALASVSSWAQPPARVSNVGSRHGPVYSSIKVRLDHLHQLSLLQDDWSDVGVTISSGLSSEFASYFSPDLADDPTALTVEALHPCALKAKAAKSDADNPTWSQAMNSPDADKWFEAMEEELTTLEPLSTPDESAPLPEDSEGDLASGAFNYVAVVGMLLYLSGHSRPDIAFAVHQCARYTFRHTRKHELALIRIGRYLKGTMDKGLILSPSDEACIDCFPDADFAGLYGHED
eukprot:CCRYP_009211-RA/>CCRYP_009211-RA protein AED:0.43 eAED:0.40 QI:0/0/0/1/1/1/2/0/235